MGISHSRNHAVQQAGGCLDILLTRIIYIYLTCGMLMVSQPMFSLNCYQSTILVLRVFVFKVRFLSASVQATEQAKEDVKRALTVLNQHLNTRTFLVGERISLADITVVCSMLWLYKQVWPAPPYLQPYTHLSVIWVNMLGNAPFVCPAGPWAFFPSAVQQCEPLVYHLYQPAPV